MLPAGSVIRTQRIGKAKFRIDHDRVPAGWTALYFARWMTNTHKPGRWGLPVSMTITIAFTPER